MTEAQERDRIFPLPLEDGRQLHFSVDLGAVIIRPVEPDAAPRLVVSGPEAERYEVTIDAGSDQVTVNASYQGRYGGFFDSEGTRLILHLPREVRATVEADQGTIAGAGLGPCELTLRSDTGKVRLHDSSGRLRLATDVGSIDAQRLEGEVTLETDAGKIMVNDGRGRLRFLTDAGKIIGRKLHGSIQAESGVGMISLEIDQLDPGNHHARTGAGKIEIELAEGLDVHVEARTGMGSMKVNVPPRPQAAARLRVATDMGAVRVRQDGVAETAGPGGGRKARGRMRFIGQAFGEEIAADVANVVVASMGRAFPRPPAPPPPRPPTPPSPPARHSSEPWTDIDDATAEMPFRGEGSDAMPAAPDGGADEMTRILELVAAGTLSPREANDLLRTLDERGWPSE